MTFLPKSLRTGLWLVCTLLLVGAPVYIFYRLETRSVARQSLLRVGIQESPPWYFIQPGGVIDGPVVEIIRDAARRTGLNIVWVADDAGPEHAFKYDKADLWPLMGRLASRVPVFPITDSWMDLSYLAVTRGRCDAARGTLPQPRTVAHRGTDVTRSIASAKFPKAGFVGVASHPGALRAVCEGTADAALVSELSQPTGPLSSGGVCSSPGLCLKSVPVATIGFGIGARPGSTAARTAAIMLREEIDVMIDDGSVAGILLRWGVSSGEIRALRAAKLAKARANTLAWIVAGLLGLVAALMLLYRKLLAASREREFANQELRHSRAELEQEFSRRMDVEERYRQAQKMDSLGRMAGGIAHDFNNLLTVINGYSDISLGDLEGHPAKPHVEEILKAGQSAADLTRQLLAFSRKQVLRTEPVNLNHIIADTAAMLRRVMGEDVELQTHLAPGLRLVLADPGQIGQVLVNLAANARDAITGHGRVVIQTSNTSLTSGYSDTYPGVAPGDYVLLCVRDNGSGMDAATLEQIFEPFFTTKPLGKGTGLGLATVYGIIRQAGGHIAVESEPGKGTTFRIYLPIVAACATPGAGVERPRACSTGSETVLIVEDHDDVRRFMAQALRASGYRVLEAAGGDEAVERAAAHPGRIDLLVTDVVMPRMNGRELAEKLSASRPNLKVLFTSGYTDDAIIQRGILTAGLNFIPKPFRAEVLSTKVRSTLDQAP